MGRSRKGAWIEIVLVYNLRHSKAVAPVRERGLKSKHQHQYRESRHVAPVRERGLKLMFLFRSLIRFRRSRKGAWIEMVKDLLKPLPLPVAPVRERGLKC